MAKANAEAVRVRLNNAEENRAVVREVQARQEVDRRKQDELGQLFDRINAECAARSLTEKRKALASPDKPEKVVKTVHYGPLPGFPSGTWWGIRMDCSRDCVHEPFNESIDDGPFGAVSICTSHLNSHNDVDLGEILTFTGREYCAADKSKDSLVLSYKNRVPVRLVRSYCLSNNFAPKTGYRYDGLYTVVHHWIGVSANSKKYRKFVLVRVLDQELPSWMSKTSVPSKLLKRKYSTSQRLTRSHKNVNSQDTKPTKFVYNKIEKTPKVTSASAIVSRQVFNKLVPGSPDTSGKSYCTESSTQSSCSSSCPTKLCNTNLSIRTNLYDSSHTAQDIKKSNMTYCKIYKSNQSTMHTQKNLHEEAEKSSTASSDTENMEKILTVCSPSVPVDEFAEKKVKKVTWADTCNSSLSTVDNSHPTAGNGFQYSGSGVVDGFSPTSPKKCGVLKYSKAVDCSSPRSSSKSNGIMSSSTKSQQHIVHSKSSTNTLQSSRSNSESFHETESMDEPSSSMDSLTPDKLVNIIVKEKYHPMAKLIIGNMIGLENKESAILSAYNTLTSKSDEEDSTKMRNKFYVRSKSRKNGVLKKQRREIANLTIDAKFEVVSRNSRNRGRLRAGRKRIEKLIEASSAQHRKLLAARRRLQSRNPSKPGQPKKPEKRKGEVGAGSRVDAVRPDRAWKTEEPPAKRPRMVAAWTQCSPPAASGVDCAVQVVDTARRDIAVGTEQDEVKAEEVVDLDDVKSEPCDVDSTGKETPSEPDTGYQGHSYYSGSAFAAVNTIDSSIRIARLRSIGFRPIGTCSPIEDEDSNQGSSRPDVDEEYTKYTTEETNVVGYMNEQLHFEDIESEETEAATRIDTQLDLLPKPIETLTEEDFNKPWHGWKRVVVDGQICWIGY